MADIEKSQAHVTEPAVAVEGPSSPTPSSQKKSFLGRFRLEGRTNDPNVLGKEFLQRALEFDEAQLEADSIKVRRKLDWMVIPMVGFIFLSGAQYHLQS